MVEETGERYRERKGAAVGEEGEDRIQGEGGGRGRCAVGLHGSLPTAAAAVSFVDRMDCIGSVQPLGGGDVDSEGKQKKKQRGFSKTCFRKKVVGRYCTLYPSRADHYLHCIYMMHFSFQTWKTEMGSKRYVTSKFNRHVRTYIHAMTHVRSAEPSFREKSGLIERKVRPVPTYYFVSFHCTLLTTLLTN